MWRAVRMRNMPHRTWPMTGMLIFFGVNAVLVSTISPVYDFVCFLPYWERRVCTVIIFVAVPVYLSNAYWC
ncbi:hypothetical protein AXF42_Ash011921 [Apostasia shenzhenica]|uniref:Uncharacterized protein n=1 Tax=Apostasia shenzhenica TaxID=1088818 RepID=A0A2I0AWA1_9ASPA|nr:hypothetical protein AXF42_Ash011921 [Apostasia shenzhenica]